MMLGPQVFEALGGAAGCRTFAESFYARVERDPILRARAKNGDTPMRRALKCRQAKVAEMLTSRGVRN